MEVVDVSITRAGFGTELGPHSSKVVAGKRKKKRRASATWVSVGWGTNFYFRSGKR
jgi:hypothetical protein